MIDLIRRGRFGELMTIAFDYGDGAELFDFGTAAELYSNKGRKFRRQPLGYRRFARAADAIRFAIEEMPAQLLQSACLEVDDVRFDGEGIRRLYESTEYPLVRLAGAPQP
jgi:hypothetical protein